MFQDAAHILRRGFLDTTGGTKADIVKPEYSVEQKGAYIKLEWDTKSIYEGGNIVGWVNRQVLCFVERADGIPQGLRINGIDEVIPVEDKEILSERLIQAIEAAQAGPEVMRHFE